MSSASSRKKAPTEAKPEAIVDVSDPIADPIEVVEIEAASAEAAEITEEEPPVSAEAVFEPTPETPDPASLGLELPNDPEAATALLLKELVTARSDAGSYLDDLQRVAADFANFRTRSERDRQITIERAAERVVVALLPVLDSLDAALGFDAQNDTDQKLRAGVGSIRDQLFDVLSKEGLEPIDSVGLPFDPEIHEAVIANGEGELIVHLELRRGYRLKGRVIRAAMVALESTTQIEEEAE